MGNGWRFDDVVVPPLRLHLPRLGSSGVRSAFRASLLGDRRLRLDSRTSAALRPPRLDLSPVFTNPQVRVPPAALRRLEALDAEREGPDWEVPEVSTAREAELCTLARAILAVPELRAARERLEREATAELERLWRRSFRERPLEGALAAPILLSVAAGGLVTLGSALELDVPELPALPLGPPGLDLHIEYVHRIEATLEDPLRPRRFGVRVEVDLMRLLRELPGL